MTDTQNLLLQGILALLGGALLGAVEATLQYVTQNGTLNLTNALVFALTTFLGLMAKALYGYVPAHVVQEVQASKELSSSLSNVIARLNSPNVQPVASTPLQAGPPLVGPLVVVNPPGVLLGAGEVAYTQALQNQAQQPLQGGVARTVQFIPNPLAEQQAASSPVLDFPENAVQTPMPTQQQNVQQIPFADQDTLTTMQVARAKAGL